MKNFVLRQIVGSWVAVAVGQASVDFNGMLRLNDTGVLLWNKLKDGADEQDLARALTAEYDVSRKQPCRMCRTSCGSCKRPVVWKSKLQRTLRT